MGRNTIDVTDATFDAEVRQSGKTVVVDFWATWCGPCTMVAPVLDEIAGEHADRLTIAKIDVDANSATAVAHGIKSIPTIIVFQAGEPVQHIVGARTKAELLEDLAQYLG
ncbi:thioredoxin [Pseudonocardia sp. GCM10023141]|uniref:thioredoxin n=1 Tax=Pseudonocardia sp. GCM10023141 TaxID=3252653 RepID=UPI00360B094C